MQRLVGNKAVQRMLAQRDPDEVQRETKAKPKSTPAAFMTIVLEQGGELKGNSMHEGHEGKFELMSFTFDPQGNVGRNPEGDSTDLHVTRLMDEMSVRLFKAAIEGEPVASAKFEFVKVSEAGKYETNYTLEFKGGHITSYQLAGNGGEQADSLSFSFPKPKS